ncbi:MAG: hypothetical protein IKK03_05615, partial [Lachnospiraceae bacterium]|nr:hypothetical protein [Lachnospiraceae bacterium]
MYLHLLVHNYILKFYDNGFHQRNGGFLKNGFAVSYARTAWTRVPEYSKDFFIGVHAGLTEDEMIIPLIVIET